MGRKKTTIKMPRVAKLKCPSCLQVTQINLEKIDKLSSVACNKCNNEIKTPVMQCCVVCAFSDKKCPYTIKMQAFSKGLQIR